MYIFTHMGGHVARRRYPNFDVFGKVTIKDYAYIGASSHIMPGVIIGEGSLIAAGSIVTKSVPDGEVWGGNPAKFICNVGDYINKNLIYDTGTKKMTLKQKRDFLLSLPENRFIHK